MHKNKSLTEKTSDFNSRITKIIKSSQFLHTAYSFFTLSDEGTET